MKVHDDKRLNRVVNKLKSCERITQELHVKNKSYTRGACEKTCHEKRFAIELKHEWFPPRIT